MHDDTSGDGSEVRFPSGDATIRGEFHAATARVAPALVLIPDVHGISALYREIAAKLAGAGFHTLILDPYSREGAPHLTDMMAVQKWLQELPDARVLADVDAAIRHLAQREQVVAGAIGVVGFCVGGQYALMAACRSTGLAACVAFYGMLRHGRPGDRKLPPPLETPGALLCPLLGLFGADDPLIPADDLSAFRGALTSAGKSFELHVFAGAGHAFMNDRRPDAYRPQVAAEAWQLAIAFLRRHLA
jgi:carboxymethylenebutenolidase